MAIVSSGGVHRLQQFVLADRGQRQRLVAHFVAQHGQPVLLEGHHEPWSRSPHRTEPLTRNASSPANTSTAVSAWPVPGAPEPATRFGGWIPAHY